MRLYKIKEIAPNKFIPQTITLIEYIMSFGSMWDGIDDSLTTWYTEYYQEEYCIHKSLEGARCTVKRYKDSIKKPKVKYHKA